MRHRDTYETKEVERDGLTIRIDWIVDEYPDTSYLGEYGDTRKFSHEPYVDRREGILYSGQTLSQERTFGVIDVAEADMVIIKYRDYASVFHYSDADLYLACRTKNDWDWLNEGDDKNDFDGSPEIIYGDAWDHQGEGDSSKDDRPEIAKIFRYIYEVLVDNLSTDTERGIYERWGGSQHLPHHPGNWEHVTPEVLDKCWDAAQRKFTEHGVHLSGNKAQDMDVLYACEDYERMRRLENGWWCYLGCVATVMLDGDDFESYGLWGIESDSDRKYLDEIEEEQIASALAQMPEEIATRRRNLDKLETILRVSGR